MNVFDEDAAGKKLVSYGTPKSLVLRRLCQILDHYPTKSNSAVTFFHFKSTYDMETAMLCNAPNLLLNYQLCGGDGRF